MTGKKIIMAVTGFFLAMYIALHLLGNTSFFYGAESMNAYAETLQSLGPLIWLLRLIMFFFLSIHIFYGIQLTLENRAAKAGSYSVVQRRRSTFAARNMIWSGLLIGAFVVFHLLHFTFPVIKAEIFAGRHSDIMGRPDVFTMVALGFRDPVIFGIYLTALTGLGLHLVHGLQSLFQTLGLNNERTEQTLIRAGVIIAAILFAGFISIPLSVFAGLLGQEIPIL
jgi:succinate dehydrogenase / fumarate reductase, cytochrome b subunit